MHRITVNKILLTLSEQNYIERREVGIVVLDEGALMGYVYGEKRLNYLRKEE